MSECRRHEGRGAAGAAGAKGGGCGGVLLPLGRVCGGAVPPPPLQKIFEFFYVKWRVLVHSGALILNLIMCQPALVLIIKYRYSTSRTILAWWGVLTHPSHPPPLATDLLGSLQLSSRFHYARISSQIF